MNSPCFVLVVCWFSAVLLPPPSLSILHPPSSLFLSVYEVINTLGRSEVVPRYILPNADRIEVPYYILNDDRKALSLINSRFWHWQHTRPASRPFSTDKCRILDLRFMRSASRKAWNVDISKHQNCYCITVWAIHQTSGKYLWGTRKHGVISESLHSFSWDGDRFVFAVDHIMQNQSLFWINCRSTYLQRLLQNHPALESNCSFEMFLSSPKIMLECQEPRTGVGTVSICWTTNTRSYF